MTSKQMAIIICCLLGRNVKLSQFYQPVLFERIKKQYKSEAEKVFEMFFDKINYFWFKVGQRITETES